LLKDPRSRRLSTLYFKKIMKNVVKIIIVNIAITLLLLFAVNFVSEAVLLIYGLAEQYAIANQVDERANLPNYVDDRDTAKLHFQESNQLLTQFEPFIGWSRKPFQGKTINIDAKGDRIHKNERKDEANVQELVPSIHFLGGSTMWGTGVSDAETIPALFNQISGIATFNKAEINFTSRQSLERLINILKFEKERINAVIFYDGVNDILNLCRSENKLGEYGYASHIKNKINRNIDKSPANQIGKYLDLKLWRGTRSLIDLVMNQPAIMNYNWDRTMNCDDRPLKARQIASALVENWEIGHDLASARGIKFLAILQPVAFRGNPKLDYLHLDSGVDNELRKQYQAVYPLVQAMMRERDRDWLLDYTDLFDRDEDIYIDFCHVSKNGNLIIAQQIYADALHRWRKDPQGLTISKE